MSLVGNVIDNNPLDKLAQRAGAGVTAAIRQASQKTGVDFAYMMEKAAAESNFKTDAKARTSSAAGLYQFIESTWLQMVNRYGDKYSLGEYAEKISDNGKVCDAQTRREILAMRNDPEIAALMAGEFAAENRQTLIDAGIPASEIGSTELYLAHFLGAGSASEFIKAMKENPLTSAAGIFPTAARANRNVFFDSRTQEAKSLGEVYAFFDKKFDTSSPVPNQTMVADNTTRIDESPAPRRAVNKNIGAIDPSSVRNLAAIRENEADLIAMMAGTRARPARDTSVSAMIFGGTPNRMPQALINDPVAIMMMARTERKLND